MIHSHEFEVGGKTLTSKLAALPSRQAAPYSSEWEKRLFFVRQPCPLSPARASIFYP